MNESPASSDLPTLPNECTVEDIRQWIAAWGRELAVQTPVLPEGATGQVRVLLDHLWEGDEPEPSPHELVALMSLTGAMGKTDEAHDTSMQILLPMLSLPEPMRRLIEVNVGDGSYRYSDKISTADHATDQ